MKRFGARYGRRLKEKYCRIESEQRRKHNCPYCRYTSVRRITSGIWSCKKCSKTFTGKAYTLSAVKKTTLEENKE